MQVSKRALCHPRANNPNALIWSLVVPTPPPPEKEKKTKKRVRTLTKAEWKELKKLAYKTLHNTDVAIQEMKWELMRCAGRIVDGDHVLNINEHHDYVKEYSLHHISCEDF